MNTWSNNASCRHCLYAFSLLYRKKSFRYVFGAIILLLIVLGVWLPELHHRYGYYSRNRYYQGKKLKYEQIGHKGDDYEVNVYVRSEKGFSGYTGEDATHRRDDAYKRELGSRGERFVDNVYKGLSDIISKFNSDNKHVTSRDVHLPTDNSDTQKSPYEEPSESNNLGYQGYRKDVSANQSASSSTTITSTAHDNQIVSTYTPHNGHTGPPTKQGKLNARKCKPVDNVIFLKTHKTGSSTIINIVQRYADTHKLKVALPHKQHFLGWPNTFREKYIFEHARGKKYNVICNHARFHRDRMEAIMTSKNTKIVTIIRDPLYQFESSAVYLNFYGMFKINRTHNVIDAFFNKSEEEIYNRTKKRNTPNIFLVKNPVAYDLGFPTWRESDGVTDRVLQKVKSDFDLVMISDYMTESLVMLKEELCWDLKDVLYFTMNKRPDKLRQKMKNVEETRRNVRKWNKIDYKIFDHFNATFWERVRNGGSKFQNEVRKLNEANTWLRNTCLESGRHFDKSQPWFPILGFKLSENSRRLKYRTLCENMIRSEIDYTNVLKLKATKFNWTIPNPRKKKNKLKENKGEKSHKQSVKSYTLEHNDKYNANNHDRRNV